MLGVLCARPRPPWIFTSPFHFHGLSAPHHIRLPYSPVADSTRHHSTKCRLLGSPSGGAACIWRVIQPSRCRWSRRRSSSISSSRSGSSNVRRLPAEPRGEGSWNVAWDARPARWLHRTDSAFLLFGVTGPIDLWSDSNPEAVTGDEKTDCENSNGGVGVSTDVENDGAAPDYKVTGVLADGRCLFRAIAHGACLRSGEEAPDEYRQRELADELRAQVVEELLKRREETEWFIEGDFDAYVKRIQQPYVWGGEPELLMASHVLKTMISVFMIDRPSGNLVNIANYGEEYRKDEVNPINVLFHGYGHYDIVETLSGQSYQKVNS